VIHTTKEDYANIHSLHLHEKQRGGQTFGTYNIIFNIRIKIKKVDKEIVKK